MKPKEDIKLLTFEQAVPIFFMIAKQYKPYCVKFGHPTWGQQVQLNRTNNYKIGQNFTKFIFVDKTIIHVCRNCSNKLYRFSSFVRLPDGHMGYSRKVFISPRV